MLFPVDVNFALKKKRKKDSHDRVVSVLVMNVHVAYDAGVTARAMAALQTMRPLASVTEHR